MPDLPIFQYNQPDVLQLQRNFTFQTLYDIRLLKNRAERDLDPKLRRHRTRQLVVIMSSGPASHRR